MNADVRPVQLTAFRNDAQGRQDALDSAMWLRACVASARGLRDDHATDYTISRAAAGASKTAAVGTQKSRKTTLWAAREAD